jgi:hypothetical protein
MAALDKIPSPSQPPAACLVCGRGTDPLGFIDLGGSIPGHGALYLCGSDAVEIARRMRWVPPELLSGAKAQARSLSVQLAVEKDRTGELEQVLAGRALSLIAGVLNRQAYGPQEEDSSGSDAAAATGGSAGGEPVGSGATGRRRARRKTDAGDGAPAGPSAGDQRSREIADIGSPAIPLTDRVGAAAGDLSRPTATT